MHLNSKTVGTRLWNSESASPCSYRQRHKRRMRCLKTAWGRRGRVIAKARPPAFRWHASKRLGARQRGNGDRRPQSSLLPGEPEARHCIVLQSCHVTLSSIPLQLLSQSRLQYQVYSESGQVSRGWRGCHRPGQICCGLGFGTKLTALEWENSWGRWQEEEVWRRIGAGTACGGRGKVEGGTEDGVAENLGRALCTRAPGPEKWPGARHGQMSTKPGRGTKGTEAKRTRGTLRAAARSK